ncbi:hypothetical protein [Halofilum ochraceum]|nr:hypothetical protein [Halofilum ochraceum]
MADDRGPAVTDPGIRGRSPLIPEKRVQWRVFPVSRGLHDTL